MVHSILTSEIRTSATRSIRRYNAYHHVSEKFVTIQFRPSCNQTKNPEVIPGIFCIGMAEVV